LILKIGITVQSLKGQFMTSLKNTVKREIRKQKAIQRDQERAERSDLDQLILLVSQIEKRGLCRAERNRLIKNIKSQNENNPEGLAQAEKKLKKLGVTLDA
tara:strand:+ start:74 stop:376 length:303 start_codon:yes stop_codon:yes gene_type:complete